MQKLTIYKIKDQLAVEYKPKKEDKEIPKDLILDYGKLYQPIKLEDIPNLFGDPDSLW